MKHKREICYWAKHDEGTRVFEENLEAGQWTLCESVNWKPDRSYIVDDEWAELRKANADGVAIQMMRRDGTWKDLPSDWWKNGFYAQVENYYVENYRVKPKEWYEDMPSGGVICWVWDDAEDQYKMCSLVVRHDPGRLKPFETSVGDSWIHAEPVHEEDLHDFQK